MTMEAGGRPTPSHAAVRRLHSGLQEGIASYASDVEADVDEIARAVADDRGDEALRVVRDHLVRLEVFADEVRRVVAGAAVEREAEAVLDDLAVPTPDHLAIAVGHAPQHAQDVPAPPTPPSHRRHRVGAAAGRALAAAASIGVVALLTVGAPASDDPLLAAVVASEEVQAAAVGAAAGSVESIARLSVVTADLRTAIAGLDRRVLADPAVRQRLQVMLADHQQSLVALSSRLPQAGRMLQQLRHLAAQLQLDPPPIPATALSTPASSPSTTLPSPGGLDDLLPHLPPLPTAAPGLPDAPAPAVDAPEPAGGASTPGEPAADDPAADDPAADDPAAADDDPASAEGPATTPPATDEAPPTDDAPAGDGAQPPGTALPPGSGGPDDNLVDEGDLGTAAPTPTPAASLPADPDQQHTGRSDLLQR